MVYCVEYDDGTTQCFRDRSGFWYTNTGYIVKWSILAGIFFIFMAWFVGGYLHAKSRMKKGLPLLGYHRWLVSYSDRRKYGQTPQNHFTFYAQPSQPQPYGQRTDNAYAEPPPMYNGNDAPPQYFAPPGATKTNPNQTGAAAMEMPQWVPNPPQGPPPPAMGMQQSGSVGGSGGAMGDVEAQNGNGGEQLPPRPQQAKEKLSNFVSRFRR